MASGWIGCHPYPPLASLSCPGGSSLIRRSSACCSASPSPAAASLSASGGTRGEKFACCPDVQSCPVSPYRPGFFRRSSKRGCCIEAALQSLSGPRQLISNGPRQPLSHLPVSRRFCSSGNRGDGSKVRARLAVNRANRRSLAGSCGQVRQRSSHRPNRRKNAHARSCFRLRSSR